MTYPGYLQRLAQDLQTNVKVLSSVLEFPSMFTLAEFVHR